MLNINERKKELLQIVSKFQYEIHGFEDVGYDFLEKDDIFVSIQNEGNNVQLALQTGGINTIFSVVVGLIFQMMRLDLIVF